jgi:hypothetical protein
VLIAVPTTTPKTRVEITSVEASLSGIGRPKRVRGQLGTVP